MKRRGTTELTVVGRDAAVTLTGPDGPIDVPAAMWPEGFEHFERWVALIDSVVDFTERARAQIAGKKVRNETGLLKQPEPIDDEEIAAMPDAVETATNGFEYYDKPQYWSVRDDAQVISEAYVSQQIDRLLQGFARVDLHSPAGFMQIMVVLIAAAKPNPWELEGAVRRYWREIEQPPKAPAMFLKVLRDEQEAWAKRDRALDEVWELIETIREGKP